jgi:hypothetical protein
MSSVFPNFESTGPQGTTSTFPEQGSGLSKRELFAAMIYQGWVSAPDDIVRTAIENGEYDSLQDMAVWQADALITQLAKKKDG